MDKKPSPRQREFLLAAAGTPDGIIACPELRVRGGRPAWHIPGAPGPRLQDHLAKDMERPYRWVAPVKEGSSTKRIPGSRDYMYRITNAGRIAIGLEAIPISDEWLGKVEAPAAVAAVPETFREFYTRTTGSPWPGVQYEPLQDVMRRIAEASADWMDELAKRAAPGDMT